MAYIKVENLKYRYPNTTKLALDGLDFEIEKGSFIGIIGENGAGKSTLCQAFNGLVPGFFKGAYGGKVLIGDTEVAKTTVSKLCQKVGLVFQNPFNQLSGAKETVFEEIAFGLQNFGVPKEEMISRVNEVMELLDIADYRDRNPFDLSGGQMQRVALAGILAMKPEVIVLDEPTSQLDPAGSEEVFAAVDKLAKSGITIIMVEQKLEKLAEYCDRILLLHQGKQIAFDSPEQIFSREDLQNYGVNPPAYTRICQAFGVKKDNGCYPASLKDALVLKDLFPEENVFGLGKKSLDHNAEIRSERGETTSCKQSVFNIEHLKFQYVENVPVLQDVNLTIDNRLTAIIGQNGAGKTTLVKLLKGLLNPVGGSIYYGGNDMAEKSVAMLAGEIGYVFQNPDDQIFKYHVIDEVMFGPQNIGMTKEQAREKAVAALKLVGLEQLADENPYDLELAERKLVAIASVLAMDTKVIILDEPTIAQDWKGRKIIQKMIRDLSSQGKTIIAILHDMDFVAESFERVIVMAHGKVLADGTKEEVFAQKDILEQARLDQPYLTKLCQRLGYKKLYFSLE
nr:ABC transporter ATP-binding protein [uncultured Mediterraneibacter sp.]